MNPSSQGQLVNMGTNAGAFTLRHILVRKPGVLVAAWSRGRSIRFRMRRVPPIFDRPSPWLCYAVLGFDTGYLIGEPRGPIHLGAPIQEGDLAVLLRNTGGAPRNLTAVFTGRLFAQIAERQVWPKGQRS